MSFWDHIKPSKPPPRALDVSLAAEGRELQLAWEDGARTAVSAQHLRRNCPCASCVDEFTGKRTLDPAQVPDDTRVLDVQQVGNYALSFTFSDTHATGIFPWGTLRELSQPEPRS